MHRTPLRTTSISLWQVTTHYLTDPALAYGAVDVVNEAVSDSGTAVLKNVQPWYPKVRRSGSGVWTHTVILSRTTSLNYL